MAPGQGAAAAAACPLLLLSDDVLEVVGHQIADALRPAVAGALAACSHNLWRVMQAPLAKLQPRHAAARALAAKVGWSCAALREQTALGWFGKRLNAADMATLAMLFSTGALARVEELFLGSIPLGPAGGSALLSGFNCGDAPRLKFLNLENTDLGDEGAASLAAALSRGALPKLEVLLFSGNDSGDEALAALAPALRQRPAFKRLDLHSNRLGDAGAACLFGNLGAKEFKQLERLDLQFNQITDAGCATLTAAIQGGSLPALCLELLNTYPTYGNPASAAARQAVRDALDSNEICAMLGRDGE